MVKSFSFFSQSGSIGKTGFQNCLQPWWRTQSILNILAGLNWKFFQPRWRNHLRFWVNLQHLKGLDFKIFFNHGEEISQFWPFWQVWIKFFFNHGEEITCVFESISRISKDWIISKFSSTMVKKSLYVLKSIWSI